MLVSKRKRYLSGPDWVINTLDYMMKSVTCAGNMSQIVLMLNSRLDERELRARLGGFLKRFPVLEGTVARDFKLTPYWKIPEQAGRDPVLRITHVEEISSPASLLPLLEKNANTAFGDESEHVSFHLFSSGKRSALAMAFDHRIFDARGAESFLHLFEQSLKNSEVSGDISFTSSMELTQWKKKFLAGRAVNRRIIALSQSTPRSFGLPADNNRAFKYRLFSFSEQETAAIYERAYNEAGYLMESPYLLAVVLQSVDRVFGERGGPETSYLVPVTTDLRPGKDPLQEIFFNYVTYLFYQVPAGDVADRSRLIAQLKQQMYDQIKSGFPRDLADASLLTRIAPLPVLGKLLYIPLKGKMATFAFSHLGSSSYKDSRLMDEDVENLFHMPRVPVPPGIGFFSNYYKGRLNLVLSHLDGILSDGDVSRIEQKLLAGFGIRQA